jgi:hypothetical protein
MQIGQLNHLDFPKSSKQSLAANSGDASTDAALGTTTPGQGVAVRQLTPAEDAPGVILTLQKENTATPGVGLANGLVYDNGRKTTASSDADGDADRMAAQYNQALQRTAGSTTRLTVDKDGVLVAGATATADTKPADFVTFAVSAMRDYADEQERLKSSTQTSASTSAASIIPRSLAEVQKLASRFKLFA